MAGLPCARVGEVLRDPAVRISSSGRELAALGLPEIASAWKGVAA
jgi:hypothetical protein